MMMEGSSGNRYDNWSKIIDDVFDDISQRLDITSAVRLAACSKDFGGRVVYGKISRQALHHWDEPCLLMPHLVQWYFDANCLDTTGFDVVPLSYPRCTLELPFMAKSVWVGMNGD
jgi:hypothetical protein